MHERLGIVGSGAIACGLAAAAARHGEVVLWARSDGSAQRARATVDKNCGRLSGEVNAEHVKIVQDLGALSDATAIIEAVVEDVDAKAALWRELAQVANDEALLGSTDLVALGRRSWPAPAGRPSASSACTSSTRCRR